MAVAEVDVDLAWTGDAADAVRDDEDADFLDGLMSASRTFSFQRVETCAVSL